MKNIFTKLTQRVLIVLVVVLSAYSTSYSQVVVPQFYNTNNGASGNVFPLGNTASNKVQWIYPPAIFNSMGILGGTPAYLGLIDKVYFRVGNSGNPIFTDFTISLAQNVGTQPVWPNATYNTGMTQVLYSNAYTITGAAGNWVEIQLQTPFLYNPALSLVFEMKQNAYTASGLQVRQNNGTGNQRIWGGFANTTGSTGSGLVDFGFDLIPPIPCDSLTLSVGTLSPNNPTICSGNNINFSAPSATLGSGLLYQWQLSTNGGATWNNIAGATTLNYQTPPITVNSRYRLIMNCTISNISDTSAPSIVTVSPPTYATLPYSQDFENWTNYCGQSDVPNDYHWSQSVLSGDNSWRREDQGPSAVWTTPNSGLYFPVSSLNNHSARFHSFSTTGSGNLDLYVNCSGSAGNKTLSFDYINDNTASGTDNLLIQYSTNGGAFFLPVQQYGSSITWQSYFVNIPSSSPNTIIRFTANGGTNAVPASDIGLDNLKVLSPCTGAPVAGIIDSVTACPNKPLNLNITGGTLFGGVNYRWESASATTGPWTFVGNSAGPTYTTTVTNPLYWRCILTCQSTNQKDTTPVRFIDVLPFYICYCNNAANTVFFENVGNVTIKDKHGNPPILNNGNPLPSLSNPTSNRPYTLFSNLTPPILYKDSSYYINVSGISYINTFADCYCKVYIDYNRDGVYNITSELALSKMVRAVNNYIALDSFKVPTISNYGLTGMRVILQQGGNASTVTPCNSFGRGEVEDYIVNLQRLPCNAPPSAGISYIDDSTTCPNNRVRLVNTTHDRFFANLNFSWQESVDGIVFNDIVGGAVDTMFRVVNANRWYRYRVTCNGTSNSYSNVVRVRILPPAQCLGVSVATGPGDLSDVGAMVISMPPPTNTNLYTFTVGGPHLNNPASYKYYTNYTAAGALDLFVDTIYKFSIYHILNSPIHNDAQVSIFIDYDANGVFDLPNEKVFTGVADAANFFLTGLVGIPPNAATGVPVMMRIVLNDDLATNPASSTGNGTYTSGETEDYYLKFSQNFGSVGVDEVSTIERVGIYPNPTPGILNIDFIAKQKTNVSIEIVSLTGSVLKTTDLGTVKGKQQISMDLTDYANGVYLMRFTTDDAKFIRKITVNK